MNQSKYIVGIDLGTSNSILAYTPAEVDDKYRVDVEVSSDVANALWRLNEALPSEPLVALVPIAHVQMNHGGAGLEAGGGGAGNLVRRNRQRGMIGPGLARPVGRHRQNQRRPVWR